MLQDEEIALVRSSVTMKQLAEMYGYTVTRNGTMKCPFHKDSHPSMKVYDRDGGFYCFVCHKGGSIFNFVMDHDGLDFESSVRHIANLYSIPLSDPNRQVSRVEKERISERIRQIEAEKEADRANKQRMVEISAKIQQWERWLRYFKPMSDPWCVLTRKIENLKIEWEGRFQSVGRKN